jgi:dTDP-4-dehydrorhamnose reductase
VTARILLTGGSGQLGRELQDQTWPEGWVLDAPSSAELDLGDPAALARRVGEGGYAAIVNAGAYTKVDAAESDPIGAWQVNALAPAVLAAAAAEAGIPIVQLSTDYVFAGTSDRPWRPDDPIAPLSVYGASKAGGELAVHTSGARHAILRTAWVVSEHGHNFVRTMLRLAVERPSVGVVADQHGSPTAARDLARAVRIVTERFLAGSDFQSGTWHVANQGFATWHELAAYVFEEAARHGHLAPALNALTTADYPTPARRPANSRLDTTDLERDFGLTLPPWQDSVAQIVRTVLEKDYR